MSNYKAITGSSKIVHRNQGGGSKLQGIASSTNLNTTAHVAFRNRNVVCPCKRNYIFCMNQLGGVGAGGIPGRSYAFAPTADGTHKHFYCGHPFGFKYKNNKHIIYPKKVKSSIGNYYNIIYENNLPYSTTIYLQKSTIWQLGFAPIFNIGKTYQIKIYNPNIEIIFTIESVRKSTIIVPFYSNSLVYNVYEIKISSLNNNSYNKISFSKTTIVFDEERKSNINYTISVLE